MLLLLFRTTLEPWVNPTHFPSESLSLVVNTLTYLISDTRSLTHTHTPPHKHTHTHTHTHTHAHTHTPPLRAVVAVTSPSTLQAQCASAGSFLGESEMLLLAPPYYH